MALAESLLAILVCPETKLKLSMADTSLVEKMNSAIDKRKLRDVRGEAVEERVDAALIRDDGKIAYAVRDDIPDLIIDEGIPLHQIDSR